MKNVLANFGLLFGTIGFISVLFIIIAGFFSCCSGITTLVFHRIVLVILAVAVLAFILCMYNNCCKSQRENKNQEEPN